MYWLLITAEELYDKARGHPKKSTNKQRKKNSKTEAVAAAATRSYWNF
jgi:hypothetical protein